MLSREEKSKMDGWDLGILIRLRRRSNMGHKIPFDMVMGELISEVGWLKGGDEELKERIEKLEAFGLISHEIHGDFPVYFITEKGKEMFKDE